MPKTLCLPPSGVKLRLSWPRQAGKTYACRRAGADARGVRYTFADMDISVAEGARFQWASDQSLLICFDTAKRRSRAEAPPLQSQITRQGNESVRRLLRLLELEPVAGICNIHPAYSSLLVKFDALRMRHDELEAILRQYLQRLEEVNLPEPRQVDIPVCYGGDFGPDLAEVCAMHGMTEAQAIELHASVEYLVYFLGFVPGFAYLGELPRELVTPRLAAPRRRVPQGSVGIAGSQTGVYPFATPGGWRLLGRTPLEMFQAERNGLSLLSIGDRVRFTPISAERFSALEKEWR